MSRPVACKYCGGGPLVEGPGRGPHWRSLNCCKCGRFNVWLINPQGPEDPAGFVMPFGKHKGLTLERVALEPDGMGYLGWASRNMRNGSVRRNIEAFLRLKAVPAVTEVPEEDPRLAEAEPWWEEIDGPEPPY